MACSAATVVLLFLSLALGMPLTGYPPSTYLAFLALALVTQVTGYVAVAYALGHLPASIVSPTMVSQPVITALLAIPILGELLTPTQWIGGAAVVAGVIVVHRSRNGG
jgi:drug/metabolite transporter (DMT)-like permease